MTTQSENEKGLPGSQDAQNKINDEELEQEEVVKEEENLGMDMGITYKEDREQDLDDLVHSQASVHSKNDIPGPDES